MWRIVGIDLGTTNSLVAYVDAAGVPRVIPDAEGRRLLPSIVAYTPAGTTDILSTYTYRIAFEDSGQQFGLAAAVSTLIFLMVAAISIIQIRATKITQDDKR